MNEPQFEEGAMAPTAASAAARPLPPGPITPPSPDPIDIARQRAEDFVHNISINTMIDLQRRMDELNNAMARIMTSENALKHYIGEFARFNFEALALSKRIASDIEKVTQPFAANPPATITQEDTK